MKFLRNTRLLFWQVTIAIVFIGFNNACIDDIEPEIQNEEELITTLKVTLIPTTEGGEVVELLFQDLDGDGGNPPYIEISSALSQGEYISHVEVLNELYQPALDITDEVEEEGEEHQFFYQYSRNEDYYIYSDLDNLGNPIGINGKMFFVESGATELTIILKHEPDKQATGVAEGNISNAGGETDIEVKFNLNVE